MYVCARLAALIVKASSAASKTLKYEIWEFNLPPAKVLAVIAILRWRIERQCWLTRRLATPTTGLLEKLGQRTTVPASNQSGTWTIQDGHSEENCAKARLRRPCRPSFAAQLHFLDGVSGPWALAADAASRCRSYDTNFHIFFASHYAQHWFDPWNTKWYAGFSQTTYPPLPQQWIAVLSHVVGLDMGYMIVQFIGILLLALGVYRFASLWVDRRAASYAALASVFIGSETFLVYAAGQLATTCAAPLYLNALPYIYEWIRENNWRSFLKGTALAVAAAAAHHATLLFGSFFFALPVLALAIYDLRQDHRAYAKGFIFRTVFVTAAIGVLIAIVLLPFWLALIKYPVTQVPIPHPSRANYILNPALRVQLLHHSVRSDDPRTSRSFSCAALQSRGCVRFSLAFGSLS